MALFPVGATMVVWQFEDNEGAWANMGEYWSEMHENYYRTMLNERDGTSIPFTRSDFLLMGHKVLSSGFIYDTVGNDGGLHHRTRVNFQTMQQMNVGTNTSRKIRRLVPNPMPVNAMVPNS